MNSLKSLLAVNAKLVLSTLILLSLMPAAADAAHRARGNRNANAARPGPEFQMPPRDPLSPNPRTASMRRDAGAVKQALTADAVTNALSTSGTLRDPKARAIVTAGLAMATMERVKDGWWRHRTGGYGWVGPVFWPFASYDILNYALWGDQYDTSFWDYGYADLHAGLFGPYSYDALTAYTRYLSHGESTANDVTLAAICGDDSKDIAGLPVDAFQKAVPLGDPQRAILGDLADASQRASRLLRASCPTTIALTAMQRLAVMQQRISAMIAAVQMIQPPLERFYSLLNDDQKAQLVTLAFPQQPGATTSATAAPAIQSCTVTQPEWPKAAIERTIAPTDAQKKGLDNLKAAAGSAADILKASCQPGDTSTPPARLAAVRKRLETMLQALNTVTVALDGFSGSLDGVQAADFNQIGSPQPSLPQVAMNPQTSSQANPQASLPADAADKSSGANSTKQAYEPRASRRRSVRYARHYPHPVQVIGRMLFSLVR